MSACLSSSVSFAHTEPAADWGEPRSDWVTAVAERYANVTDEFELWNVSLLGSTKGHAFSSRFW